MDTADTTISMVVGKEETPLSINSPSRSSPISRSPRGMGQPREADRRMPRRRGVQAAVHSSTSSPVEFLRICRHNISRQTDLQEPLLNQGRAIR